ncbi:threonine--tRNA ligase [Patescibacteria group bacterium]
MKNKNEKLELLRHSLSHILMQALTRLYGAIPGVGPAIENGFYHDIDAEYQITAEDIPKIEKEMKKIIKANYPIEKKVMPIDEGIKFLKEKGYIYTAELAEDLKKEGKAEITFYQQAEFINMCKGPHLEATGKINPDGFKLTKLAGAYWKGDEKNKMIQRLYGVAFETKDELEKYLKMMEEAEKRDHRKIGSELDLFSFSRGSAGLPGSVYWHPKGTIIYQEIISYIREKLKKFNYGEIRTPMILNRELWKKSGHWEKYKENMFFAADTSDIEDIRKGKSPVWGIKPMNCPGAIAGIYNAKKRSYKEFPLRIAEFGMVYRNEEKGVIHGLFRARAFTQDDAHIFCTEDQLISEIEALIDIVLSTYKDFGFDDINTELSTRPKKYIGSLKTWDKAEKILEASLKNTKLKFVINEGDGAFYGPKIDFHIKDALNRSWQLGTIQLDFSMPEKLDAKFTDKDGKEKAPIMLHRAVLGSLERFIGILVEHYGGAFPLWLSPVQVKIISVGEGHIEFCNKLADEFKEQNVRVEVDSNDETVGNKIRKARTEKIPYVLVIGDKEMNSDKLHINVRGKKEIIEMTKNNFFGKIKEEIGERV